MEHCFNIPDLINSVKVCTDTLNCIDKWRILNIYFPLSRSLLQFKNTFFLTIKFNCPTLYYPIILLLCFFLATPKQNKILLMNIYSVLITKITHLLSLWHLPSLQWRDNPLPNALASSNQFLIRYVHKLRLCRHSGSNAWQCWYNLRYSDGFAYLFNIYKSY